MNFALTELQEMLRDQAARFIEREYAFESRRALAATPGGYSEAHWRTFAELGWLGLPLPEAHGGFGGSGADLMVLMESFGRGLVLEPYLASVVLGGGALAACDSEALKHEWLPALAGGERKLALAYAEAGGRYDPAWVETRAQRAAGGYRLHGAKVAVLHGGCADALVVSARCDGTASAPDGIALFLVPARSPGVTLRPHATADGLRAAVLTLEGVELPAQALLGAPGQGHALLEAVLDRGCAALCAEAVGCMEALLGRTVDYLKTREQFGRKIGAFQVLQHRAVDMYVALEEARSLALLAALRVDGPAAERRRAVAAAKHYIGVLAHRTGQAAVQLHGGIGVSDELDVAHYFKRLTMLDHWLGDADYHLGRYRATQRAD